MAYKELVAGYELEIGVDVSQGRRIFIGSPSTVVSAEYPETALPSRGDRFDSTSETANILLRRIRKTPYGGRADIFQYDLFYGTPNNLSAAASDDTIHIGDRDMDHLRTEMDLGVEAVVVDVDADGENPAFKWEEQISGSDTVYQPLFKMIPTGSFTLSQKVADIGQFNNIAISKVGGVNNASFKGFPEECVLFMGHKATQETKDGSQEIWSVEMLFQWKVIPLERYEDGSVDLGGWNYFPRREYGATGEVVYNGWGRILSRSSGRAAYRTVSFDDLVVAAP